MHILMVGAGAYGRALAKIATDNYHTVQFFDPYKFQVSLEKATEGAEVAVLAIPSCEVSAILKRLPKKLKVVLASKGVIDFENLEKFEDWAVLSAPAFAKELLAQKEVNFVVTAEFVKEVFAANFINFQMTNDAQGVILCGALKNIYAVLAGAESLKAGEKKFTKFIKEAIVEMRRVLDFYDCNIATTNLACGEADLMLTCGSLDSRNYQFGQAIREGKVAEFLSEPKTLEAMNSVRQAGAVLMGLEGVPNLRRAIGLIRKFGVKNEFE